MSKPDVRRHFKRNFIYNMLDGAAWLVGESFVSVNTILPVFANTLTHSAILIGLVPALINAGWYLPQLFMAGYVHRLKRKLRFTLAMAVVERIPYFIFPLTAYLLHWIPVTTAIWLFMFVVAWRGFASGMVALPWQVVVAEVIPGPVRSRFFGIGRMFGRVLGVGGSGGLGSDPGECRLSQQFRVEFPDRSGFHVVILLLLLPHGGAGTG